MSRERRPLLPEEETTAEPGRYGCPMLVRAHYVREPDATPVMRCALAWALHGDEEVARCLATDVLTDCWKVHPERTPVVAQPATADQIADVADD